jgi:hypothetical protein
MFLYLSLLVTSLFSLQTMASDHKALNAVAVAERCLLTIVQQCAVDNIY